VGYQTVFQTKTTDTQTYYVHPLEIATVFPTVWASTVFPLFPPGEKETRLNQQKKVLTRLGLLFPYCLEKIGEIGVLLSCSVVLGEGPENANKSYGK